MALSFVGTAHAEATTVTLPTHQAGDLILIVASANAVTTIPTIPGTYTPLESASANGTVNADVGASSGYLIAASSSETSGTWTNATHITAVVYRSSVGQASIGNTAQAPTTTGTTLSIPGLTLDITDGSSWVVSAGLIDSGDADLDALSGMTRRGGHTTGVTNSQSVFDTNGGVASFSAFTDAGYGSSRGRIGFSFEIKEVSASFDPSTSLVALPTNQPVQRRVRVVAY